jgi:hypothetical protein
MTRMRPGNQFSRRSDLESAGDVAEFIAQSAEYYAAVKSGQEIETTEVSDGESEGAPASQFTFTAPDGTIYTVTVQLGDH